MHTATNIDVSEIREQLGLSRSQLAELAFVDESTVWRWETQGVPERGPARALLLRLKADADKVISDAAAVSP